MRKTACEVDLSAIGANVAALIEHVAPTPVCAVVKADGYGHGAVPVAQAALEAGASWLAVALVEEGVELREAGIDAPVLVLSEADRSSVRELVRYRLRPTVYTEAGIHDLELAVLAEDRAPGVRVHLGVDTGMRRVGAEPARVEGLVDRITTSGLFELEAVWTHCPVADDPDNPFTDAQLRRFDGLDVALPTHVANSATALTRPDRSASMVRCGITIYGIDPDPAVTGIVPLRPAMTLRSAVSFVKPIEAGESVAYGHRWTAARPSIIATVPIGYADGVRRDLGLRGGEVLIGGQRWPIVGVVTMDQLMVDVTGGSVAVGDEVVLIGAQGDQRITATDVAERLGTIGYEVVCAVSKRVPRTYVH